MATITGTTGNDTITPALVSAGVSGTPTGAGDVIIGGLGNDSIDGGGGFDTLDYSAFAAANRLTVTFTSATGGTVVKNALGTDSFTRIGSVLGSLGTDMFTGFSGASSLISFHGLGGNDSFNGANNSLNQVDYTASQAGVDVHLGSGEAKDGFGSIDTLTGVLRVRGSTFGDTLTGGAAGETFSASTGDDTINGGGGGNTLDYGSGFVDGPVTVTYAASGYSGTVAKGGASGTDSFSNINNIGGNGQNDTLIGSDDTATGLSFAILLRGRFGDDFIDGRKSQLNQARYNESANGVTINLQTGIDGSGNWFGTAIDGNQVAGQATGVYHTDTLKNVTRAGGSNHNDTITGGDANDRFDVSGGSDTYDGGAGFNMLDYGFTLSGLTKVTVTLTGIGMGLFGFGNASVAKSGIGGTDTLTGFNDYRGTAGNDEFLGNTAEYTWNSIALRGGAGNDTINGFGKSSNRADYSGAGAATEIDLTAGFGKDGQGGSDTLTDVRGVITSFHNDTIGGSAFDDTIAVQSAGLHTIDGRAGDNTVNYRGSDAITLDLGTVKTPGAFGGYQGSIAKTAGTDTILNFNTAYGGAGNDTVYGTPDDDTIGGGQGSNLLDGRGGLNTLGYRSWQGLSPTHGAIIDLASGTATNPWDGTDTLVGIQNAQGSQFADSITGVAVAGTRTFIRGDGGDDTLVAGTVDTLITASWSNSLAGVFVDLDVGVVYDDGWFGGFDTLFNIQSADGSAFDDDLTGGDRADRLDGNAGGDALYGGAGNDTLNGGEGEDYLEGDAGLDRYAGGEGADAFRLLAGPTEWVDSALAAMDIVVDFDAGEGDRLLINDVAGLFDGPGGSKALLWQGALAAVAAPTLGLALPGHAFAAVAYAAFWLPDAATGGWVVLDTDRDGTLGADDFIARIDGVAALGSGDFAENTVLTPILGNGTGNALAGTTGLDVVGAGAGADTVFGLGGDDTLDGGSGADRLSGGTGNDTFLVDTQGDLVFEAAGEGTDTVISTASFYLYANLETLMLATGAGGIFGVGTPLANTLIGNESGNTMLGGDGNDTVLGNAGNDILYAGLGDDSMDGGAGGDYLAGSTGNDTLRGGLNGDNLYGEAGDDSLVGGTDFVFDRLVGGLGNDTLDGASGFGDFDYLYGNDGSDTFTVDTPFDLVFEQPNQGADTVFANILGAGYYLYGNIENLTLQGTTPFGVGNALDNVLTGSFARNTLLGGLGNDTINGKGGNDVLFGQGGTDTFGFERGTSRDVIGDFAPGTDKLQLIGLGFGSFAQVLMATAQNGVSCVIDFGLGEHVILQNVQKAALAAGDFILA